MSWCSRARVHFVAFWVLITMVVGCAVPAPPYEVIPLSYTGGVVPLSRAVSYGPDGDQKADIYISNAEQGTVVYLHGGGWVLGSRQGLPSLMSYLVTQGWDVVSIDYRLARRAPFPTAVHDASRAVDWVRERGAAMGLDTETIVLAGWSAGANIAMLAAYGANAAGFPGGKTSPVDGVISLAGIYDMRSVGLPELDEAGGWLHSVAGGRQDSSPVVWLDAGDPPTLAAHGVRDPIVPVEQVRAFAAASVRTGHDRGLTVLEASSPAFGEACVGHMPWCGVPVAEVNRFLADL
ncbi:MAG: alpha/beta hydrolase [Microthrixaceae bacterium]|nr:alpha/beta hydrolase [Microthrixaceae bacterium]